MISFGQKGNFAKIDKYFEKIKKPIKPEILEKYGQAGVEALMSATPTETGKTANSWQYKIKNQNGFATIEFHNTNFNKGIPIAIILQYGHGTGTGGWVQGIDYINPAIRPIFLEITNEAWKEVTSV